MCLSLTFPCRAQGINILFQCAEFDLEGALLCPARPVDMFGAQWMRLWRGSHNRLIGFGHACTQPSDVGRSVLRAEWLVEATLSNFCACAGKEASPHKKPPSDQPKQISYAHTRK